MPTKDATNRRKRRLVHPCIRLKRGIPAALHFCEHSPTVATIIFVFETLVGFFSRVRAFQAATNEFLCDVKARCRKSIAFKRSGRRDAACGESRHGCRVSPCLLQSMLFREAAGHLVSRKGGSLVANSVLESLHGCIGPTYRYGVPAKINR